ncbi:MAG: hypothetical protein FJ115_04680 [Deltaproteobacteria bacterium]|nr:hypothetical protein [Deltaproteobacteria bacterium]
MIGKPCARKSHARFDEGELEIGPLPLRQLPTLPTPLLRTHSTSKKYSLLSTLTSFVAVEKREEKDKSTGEIVLRKVPALVTVGWHGMGRVLPDLKVASIGIMSSILSPMRVRGEAPMRFLKIGGGFADKISYPSAIPMAKEDSTKREQQRTDLLMDILSLQKMQGGLGLNDRMAKEFDIDLKKIRKLASIMELGIPEDKFLVISTAILLQILRVHFLSEESTWRKVVRKSETWLNRIIQTGKPTIEGRELADWAEDYVRENVRQ